MGKLFVFFVIFIPIQFRKIFFCMVFFFILFRKSNIELDNFIFLI